MVVGRSPILGRPVGMLLLARVPGGVGPMAIATLLHQTVVAAERLARATPDSPENALSPAWPAVTFRPNDPSD